MKIEMWDDVTSFNKFFKIELTDYDILRVYGNMTNSDKQELKYFGREGASLEETLMGLQVYARVLERLEKAKIAA